MTDARRMTCSETITSKIHRVLEEDSSVLSMMCSGGYFARALSGCLVLSVSSHESCYVIMLQNPEF